LCFFLIKLFIKLLNYLIDSENNVLANSKKLATLRNGYSERRRRLRRIIEPWRSNLVVSFIISYLNKNYFLYLFAKFYLDDLKIQIQETNKEKDV